MKLCDICGICVSEITTPLSHWVVGAFVSVLCQFGSGRGYVVPSPQSCCNFLTSILLLDWYVNII